MFIVYEKFFDAKSERLVGTSLQEIAEWSGRTNHTTVIHAIRTMRGLIAQQPGFKSAYDQIHAALAAKTQNTNEHRHPHNETQLDGQNNIPAF